MEGTHLKIYWSKEVVLVIHLCQMVTAEKSRGVQAKIQLEDVWIPWRTPPLGVIISNDK